MPRSCSPFAATYANLLRTLLDAERVASVTDSSSVGSSWGTKPRDFREKFGVTFDVHTAEVLLVSAVRPINVSYAVGSSEWMLRGSNDLETVQALNPRGAAFSHDGFTLSGAFGHRLRVRAGDQLGAVIRLLREDPTSRRAIALIGDGRDIIDDSKDFPCATSLHFLLRNNRLHAVLHLRSSSVFGVLPYDLVNFAHIHRFVAWSLGVPAGLLRVFAGSAHVYEEEVPLIERFLTSEFDFVDIPVLDWRAFTLVADAVDV